jgi:hypothetical protein
MSTSNLETNIAQNKTKKTAYVAMLAMSGALTYCAINAGQYFKETAEVLKRIDATPTVVLQKSEQQLENREYRGGWGPTIMTLYSRPGNSTRMELRIDSNAHEWQQPRKERFITMIDAETIAGAEDNFPKGVIYQHRAQEQGSGEDMSCAWGAKSLLRSCSPDEESLAKGMLYAKFER